MSQENFEVVTHLIAALNERDADRYLSFCTRDIELNQPTSPIDDRVLVFGQLHVVTSGGVALQHQTTNVYEMARGKVCRVDVYHDREKALDAVGLGE
jgi:ketosteroid isomerase-like protein